MMQTVQLAITDAALRAEVREALSRTCAWRLEAVDRPDPSQNGVLVLDEAALDGLPFTLTYPERVVLIARQETNEVMSRAWDAGIVSVVSVDDPINTVLLAIMAAALRVAKSHHAAAPGGISPSTAPVSASLSPEIPHCDPKRCKNQ